MHKVNQFILSPKVRLINHNGDMIGIVSRHDAMSRALEVGLDLVEISPHSVPPVCKILDYGKFKYENQKKRAEAKKKQKTIEIKETKVTATIGEHDYKVKLNNMKRFLEDGNKVKVSMRFRGREMSHQELGTNLMARIREDLSESSKVEHMPQLEGRQMIMILGPKM